MMEFRSGHASRENDICNLFVATFSASEGQDEGAIIGGLVRDLMKTTPNQDLFVWSAYEDEELLGCIFFSRLAFAQDDRTAFILSPVAVKTDRQKTGIGQKLITHGLDGLRQNRIDFVTTYGDPNYYAKAGFRQITEEFAQAPLTLSFPEGWLGQSLTGADERPLIGASSCVSALNKPELW
jgi:putative acetyltransferase